MYYLIGLVKLRELIRAPGLEVFVRQANPNSYIKILKEIKNKEIHNIVIDTSSAYIANLLKGVIGYINELMEILNYNLLIHSNRFYDFK